MFDSGTRPYHGVLADDSRGVPVVDIDSSRVVVLFRCSYGHIWTETKQRTKSVPVKSLNEYINGRMCLWMRTTAFINLFTFRWPVPGKQAVTVSLNRQLSVVSGRKNLCNLWESGNKTIKCWRGHWNNVSLSHFHSKPIYKLSFYKPKTLPWHVEQHTEAGRAKREWPFFFTEHHAIVNSLCWDRIKQVICRWNQMCFLQ